MLVVTRNFADMPKIRPNEPQPPVGFELNCVEFEVASENLASDLAPGASEMYHDPKPFHAYAIWHADFETTPV